MWAKLRPTVQLGMTIYGGTAIALRLGHRASVDLFFFTSEPLDKQALREKMPFLRDTTVLQDQTETLTVLALSADTTSTSANESGGVKLSVFCSLLFGRVGEPEMTDDDAVLVASVVDLLATRKRHSAPPITA